MLSSGPVPAPAPRTEGIEMPVAVPVPFIGQHPLSLLLLQLAVLLALALALGRLAVRFALPSVVGELCAGVILGPSILGHALPDLAGRLLPRQPEQTHLLDAVGQVGVLLLVGITGMELDIGLIRRHGLTALRISLAGLFLPLGLGVGVGLLLPAALVPDGADRTVFALFLSVAMCVSAIPVIAKLLLDMNLLHRGVGQLTLMAGMVDDGVGWFLLSVVSVMATGGLRPGTVVVAVLSPLGVVVFAALIGRPLVRIALRAAARSAEVAPTVATAVVIVLLGAAATQALKLEAVFGAFVAGLVIATSGEFDRDRLAGLRVVVLTVLAPIFFASAGLRMDLTALARPIVLISAIAVLVVAVVGKFAGAYLGARLSRLNGWEALAIGAGMNARGVIEVIVAMTGLRLGILNPATYTIIVLVAIVTSLMAPPVLRRAMARADAIAAAGLGLDDDLSRSRPAPPLPRRHVLPNRKVADESPVAAERPEPGHPG
jgi:Kef-type K+ transport system membrane component KefB